MGLTAVLIVGVLGVGGPHQAHPSPTRLNDATIEVRQAGKRVARSDTGHIRVRLRRGTYRVTASLRPPNVGDVLPCGARTVHVKRDTRRVQVTLYCSIK